ATRTEAALARCGRLAINGTSSRAEVDIAGANAMIDAAAAAGLAVQLLVPRAGIDPGVLVDRIDALVQSGAAVRAGEVLVTPSIVADLKSRLVAALAAHHRAQPLAEGVPREELREQLFGRGHADIF